MSSAVQTIVTSVEGRFLLLGCTDGLRAYDIQPTGVVKKLIPSPGETPAPRGCRAVGGPVRAAAVLGQTPLLAFALEGGVAPELVSEQAVEGAVVGGESTSSVASTSRVLYLYDAAKSQTMAELHFETAVVGIKMNVRRLVVALVECIHVFDLTTLEHLAELRTASPPNPNGLLVLSELTTNVRGEAVSYLAFPQSDQGYGDVWVAQIAETQMDHNGECSGKGNTFCGERCGFVERVSIVKAHHRAVVCLAMTRDGTRLATASERGTTVKVFEPSSARLLYHFRRGVKVARMLSLSFDPASALSGLRLAALSNRGTLHVFRCSSAGGSEVVTPAPALLYTGLELRSFAQATVGKASAASSAPPGLGLDDKTGCEVQCCFFSENERFVFVVLPEPCALGEDAACAHEEWSGGASLLHEQSGVVTSRWTLQKYRIHMHECTLVDSYVLN
ncbi:hypothetical protein TraAM80_05540 [Trypanosoma rangeli]|uniref:Uncharacterized protein n=1 Tax=Trypanosoma rangeli TaxID=5698 RepID=A0A422NEB0_TRYRA|nr:uncharacterized protein TraAM80_05540 [Trypanosoma rangeli]RNF03844.1 hypothetical protein TraAM80_05540 [Trypanosoma rangeli]|eukprot:RNF03844.1 hypothetical protein TraAM80_05540 [Trypanosoma rangeli]